MAIIKNPLTVVVQSGGGENKSIIRTAELPNITITLSQNGTDIESKTSIGGVVEFNVDTIGIYTLTASGTGIVSWTRNVEVKELNTIVECKAGTLSNYSEAQIHTALQGGYFSKMFSLQDEWTLVSTGNILNNYKFFVEKITEENGKEIVDFRMNDVYAGATYQINSYITYYLTSQSSQWFYANAYTYGGYKYSSLRQTMMERGDEVYTQASGILPDDYSGTLTTGVKFSSLKYTNGESCSIYSYSSNSDTMTKLNSIISAQTALQMMFIKGYFKSVGQIDQTTFNNGVYYTQTIYGSGSSSRPVYTLQTTYDSSATYYGLYETLQEDGIFANALKTSNIASYLVKFNDYAGTGAVSRVSNFSDYCNIPALEEITGLNRTMTLPSGKSAQNVNAYNLANEGTMEAYDFKHQATGTSYWTRSTGNSTQQFSSISANGGISTTNLNSPFSVRLGFRLG